MIDARMYCPLRLIGKSESELEQAKCKRDTCMWWGIFTSNKGPEEGCSVPCIGEFSWL